MNLLHNILITTAIGMTATATVLAENSERRVLTLFDEAVFYDGYNSNVMDADLDDGILRHRNSLYARRLTEEQLRWFGSDMDMHVIIGALCDDYDRIGNINLALVPKGAETYNPDEVKRVELARFITPFMNKNKMPDEVPYNYIANSATLIFRDARLKAEYDFWIEFEVFGIPYSANEKIRGCSDRNDVFRGSLSFDALSEPAEDVTNHVFVPIVIKKPENIGGNFNNYSDGATDEPGKAIKTWEFEVPEDVADSRIVLIISNHGANQGGEEYIRRLHEVSVDGQEVLTFTPGGISCEPWRQYNTMDNGIYSTSRPDSFWKRYSNWCPGAPIPVREIETGTLKAGKHTVTINVPKAVFRDEKGDFPVSMYFQGLTEGKLPAGFYTPEMLEPETTVSVSGDAVCWSCDRTVDEAVLYSARGEMLRVVPGTLGCISLQGQEPGIYFLNLRCTDGTTTVRKFRH